MIDIQDNFLSQENFDRIKNIICSGFFPWYSSSILNYSFSEDVTYNFQLCHVFYDNNQKNSDYYEILSPILNNLNLKSVIRIKSNLNLKTEKIIKHGFHNDFEFDCYTSIFYVNTNNGFTEFENGDKIESIENRLVTFKSSLFHTGTTCTNSPYRCVINFNYF